MDTPNTKEQAFPQPKEVWINVHDGWFFRGDGVYGYAVPRKPYENEEKYPKYFSSEVVAALRLKIERYRKALECAAEVGSKAAWLAFHDKNKSADWDIADAVAEAIREALNGGG